MARGPLPAGNARRRNPPTVPTTSLPAGGRKGRPPKVPGSYNLGDAGRAWWTWAWGLPQAAAWDKGALYVIARRAQLEDELAALRLVDEDGVAELLGLGDEEEMLERLRWLIAGLKSMAGGSTTVMREMRELDGRLGLSPKALADLRWTIVAETEQAPAAAGPLPPNVRRLPAIDPAAAVG